MTSHQNFEVDKQLDESFVQSQSTGQILYLDSAFKGFRYQLSKIKFRNMKVDNDFFGKESEIDKLYRRAVGCRATCLFCKRKCQEAEDCQNSFSQTNSADSKRKHNCNDVGHQMRIFKGAYF